MSRLEVDRIYGEDDERPSGLRSGDRIYITPRLCERLAIPREADIGSRWAVTRDNLRFAILERGDGYVLFQAEAE